MAVVWGAGEGGLGRPRLGCPRPRDQPTAQAAMADAEAPATAAPPPSPRRRQAPQARNRRVPGEGVKGRGGRATFSCKARSEVPQFC